MTAMRPEDIDHRLRERPFVPFRLCMSDGKSFEVRHPEMAIVSRRIVALAVHRPRARMPETVTWCDPMHVIRIEPLDGRPPRQRRSK